MTGSDFFDITFCPYYDTCKSGEKCRRSLTEEVRMKSRKENIPLYVFMQEPECYKEKTC